MPTTIKLKNSVTTTNTPTSLAQGEVAINITDKKVWVGNAATTPIQLLGAGSSASFGALTCTSLTNSGLTSGRVTYAITGGLLTDSANMTFNGTTLTVADFTDSSLTANRVVYATTAGNLTTSAGLTFDGTTFATTGAANFATSSGNVGIGTSSPTSFSGYTVVDAYNGTTGAFFLVRNPTKTGQFTVDTNGVRIGSRTNDFLALTTNDTERMRITSTGSVGIGTSSPTNGILEVGGLTNTAGQSASAFAITRNDSTNLYKITWVVTSNEVQFSGNTKNFVFKNASGEAETMRIDSSGNVGIGTSSPSSYGKLAVVNNGTNGLVVSDNATTDLRIDTSSSVTTLRNSAVASLAFNTNGGERMRIDSSGNVLVGSTSTAGTTQPLAITVAGRLRSTQGTTASIANGATVDITLTYPRATVAYLIQSSVNTGNSSAGLFWSNDNGASSTFTLFGQNQNNVAVTSPAAGTIRITNNTGGTCAFNYAFTIIAGL